MPEPEKKNHSWIIIAALAVIVYFFAAARPLGKELTFIPVWSAGLGGAAQSASDTAPRPFDLSGTYGFFSVDGKLLLSAKSSGRVAVSSRAFAEYGDKDEPILFKRADGKDAFAVKDSGFPAFVSDRLFLTSKDGTGISGYSPSGSRQWTRDLGSVLTCFDANGSDAVAGGLDGRVVVIGPDGSLAFDYSPGGSRLGVIFGCALSADSSLIALVCGIDKQRFILLEKRSDGYRVAYHSYLASDFRRRVFVDFSDDGRYALYESDGGLSVLDVRTRKTYAIAVSGALRTVRSSASGDFFLILSEEGIPKIGSIPGGAAYSGRFKAIRVPDTTVMEAPFSASGFFLDRSGDRVFLGGEDRMAGIDMGCYENAPFRGRIGRRVRRGDARLRYRVAALRLFDGEHLRDRLERPLPARHRDIFRGRDPALGG
jgi:hypothetical protein